MSHHHKTRKQLIELEYDEDAAQDERDLQCRELARELHRQWRQARRTAQRPNTDETSSGGYQIEIATDRFSHTPSYAQNDLALPISAKDNEKPGQAAPPTSTHRRALETIL